MLAVQGAHVIVSSRKIDDCHTVANSIIEAGYSAAALACHVGDMAQIADTFQTIRKLHGKLDILVNNAAAMRYCPA